MIPSLDQADKKVSRSDYNKLVGAADKAAKTFFVGGDDDNSAGNPVQTVTPDPELGFWARITDFCRGSDGKPLQDNLHNLLYQWIEATRDVDGSGNLVWRDRDPGSENCRLSVQIAVGVYRNAAREMSVTAPATNQSACFAQPNQIVWMYPGYLAWDSTGCPDPEPLFVTFLDGFAIAQSDWVMGTWRTGTDSSPGTDDYVTVKQCVDMDGSVQFGPAFNVYFHKRSGVYDPAIFGPYTNYYGTQRADVITYRWDYVQQQFFCTSPDAYDDQLGCVKFFWGNDIAGIGNGWNTCDGTTPGGTKIGALPDTRGYYTRALETQGDTLWAGGGTQGLTTNVPGQALGAGGRCGTTNSLKTLSDSVTGVAIVKGGGVQQMMEFPEDIEAWSGPASDGSPTPNNHVVVAPPTAIMQQIIRYK